MSAKTRMLDEVQKYFESVEFDVQIALCSGYSLVYDIIRDDPGVKVALNITNTSAWAYGRLTRLLNQQGEPDYQLPYEGAMAAYLYIIWQQHPTFADTVARQIINDQRFLHYPRRLARQILDID